MRSGDNADLASGYANVVVLSPFGGRSRTPPERGADPAGQFEGLRKFPGADLASQVEALRKQGSRVEVITPDADSRAAMGTNQMDPATRIPAARAGFAQGKQKAARRDVPRRLPAWRRSTKARTGLDGAAYRRVYCPMITPLVVVTLLVSSNSVSGAGPSNSRAPRPRVSGQISSV